jgi:Protein of unknown function, DUF481
MRSPYCLPLAPPFSAILLPQLALVALLIAAALVENSRTEGAEPNLVKATGGSFAARAVSRPLVETVTLVGGSRLTGRAVATESGQLIWELDTGERLRIPLESVSEVTASQVPPGPAPQIVPEVVPLEGMPKAVETPPESDSTGTVAVMVPNPATHPDDDWTRYVPLYSTTANLIDGFSETAALWTKRIQLGGQFISGNVDLDQVDFVSEVERSTPTLTRQIDIGGQWSRARSKLTANRWWLNSNFDRPIHNEWITFITTKNEYNEITFLNYRGTVSTGLGYRFLNEEKKRLIVRFGPAYTLEMFTKEPFQRESPDVFGEIEMRWPMFDRTSFEQRVRVQPSILNYELVRVFSNTGLVIDLDDKDRWKLRLGLRYEYNSEPSIGRQPEDFYSTLNLVYVRK